MMSKKDIIKHYDGLNKNSNISFRQKLIMKIYLKEIKEYDIFDQERLDKLADLSIDAADILLEKMLEDEGEE
jgi:hypothetical protein